MPICPNCAREFYRTKQRGVDKLIPLQKVCKVGSVTLYYCPLCHQYYMKRQQTIRCPVCKKVMRHIHESYWQCRVCGKIYDVSKRPMVAVAKTQV